MWHEALEEASRLYFGEHNIEGMLKVLEPLHEMLEEGARKDNVTIQERAFIEVCPFSFLVFQIWYNIVFFLHVHAISCVCLHGILDFTFL